MRVIVAFLLSGCVACFGDSEADLKLFEATRSCDVNGVGFALKQGANPNSAFQTKQLSFICNGCGEETEVSEKTCLAILEKLLDAGMKLNPHILFAPIANGYAQVVDVLVAHGIDPNTIIDGLSSVELAEYYGKPKVVAVLIKRGATPISRREAAQLRLVQCASSGDLAGLKMAILNGADINGKINDGSKALTVVVHYVPFRDAAAATKYLLENGADPDIDNENGDKPLHIIMNRTSYLLNRIEPNDTQSSLHPAYMSPANCKLAIEALLKAGAKVSARNRYGQTPLHIAAKYNNLWGAQKLIDSGAKLMDRDDSGKTPLDYAESAEMIKLLKSHGATEQ